MHTHRLAFTMPCIFELLVYMYMFFMYADTRRTEKMAV